jgi:hypothetical protein
MEQVHRGPQNKYSNLLYRSSQSEPVLIFGPNEGSEYARIKHAKSSAPGVILLAGENRMQAFGLWPPSRPLGLGSFPGEA